MTATTDLSDSARPADVIRARPSGFLSDLFTIAGRGLRSIPREPEVFIPAIFIPAFFFIVNIGALQDLTEAIPGNSDFDYRAFQMPTAIIFAVTGISRAPGLVTDIQTGYFDRLLLTPTRRVPLLLGLQIADFVLVCALTIPVIILGFILGVGFETGILGFVFFVLMAGLWGLAFTGFPYAIALKTGNPAAVATSFILFFPFAFLTSSTVPFERMTGWLQTIARFNPLTYILDAMRVVLSDGWEWATIGKGLLAIGIVFVISQSLAMAALRGRVNQE